MIYLDYQATTPLAPEALAAMLPWLENQHANPHSAHVPGRAAKAAVEVARDNLAALLPVAGKSAFTSGATEAINWAIKGAGPGRIVTLATEHAATLDTVDALARTGREVVVLPVDADGLVDRAAAQAAIVPGTALVAAMLVNNEIGVVQPIAELAEMAHAAGALVLCDAVQGFGRLPIPAGCDMIAVSAHKIHGPKGIGALWVRDGVTLAPLLHGGGQEALGRSGTLSPALCAGFGAAARLAVERQAGDAAQIERLWVGAVAALGPRWTINGSVHQRYHGNLNVRRDGLDVARLMSDLRDLAFSAGSACASGSGRSSHVLRAIGLSEALARSSIRIGFGRYTTEAELTDAIDRINAAADAQRAAA
ncbi:cysteine desulfurase family protein [Sphingomonas alpina]|uniref:Cysteine desulfurase n=1 Tax=Sphingomonas alpina TaxID=653931 RepID=A0A7H0LQF9_9SPHN|nr:cysteine desulfurase family protein [Sphingomonas alpina]QNQ11912.1 cysteine desulfurase [Sphingomonas alpina]